MHGPAAVRAILDSPSYRQADHDVDFLSRGDTVISGSRLTTKKPNCCSKERGIGNTIVVFGSTRICEPACGATQGSKA